MGSRNPWAFANKRKAEAQGEGSYPTKGKTPRNARYHLNHGAMSGKKAEHLKTELDHALAKKVTQLRSHNYSVSGDKADSPTKSSFVDPRLKRMSPTKASQAPKTG